MSEVTNEDDEWITTTTLQSGTSVRFRHVRPEDEALIVESISTASRQTLLHRFFSPIRRVSPETLRKMLAINRTQETCIVGVVDEAEKKQIICGARYVRSSPDRAEIALTVHDNFQRQGLGKFMLELIIRIAQSEGIRWFEADVMTSNLGMLKLLDQVAGPRRKWHREGDVFHVVIELAAIPKLKPESRTAHAV